MLFVLPRINFITREVNTLTLSFIGSERKYLGKNPVVILEHISTDRMDADIFTKALEYPVFIGHAIRVTGSLDDEE